MTDMARMEAEANAFAMELLMPFDWIVRDASGIDLCDERAVEKLAKKYRVAPTVMAVRIGEVRRELELCREAAQPASPIPGYGEREAGDANQKASQ